MKTKKRKFQQHNYEKVINLHLQNYTLDEISLLTDIGRTTIWKMIMQYRKTKSKNVLKVVK